jgi:hypothetical protein
MPLAKHGEVIETLPPDRLDALRGGDLHPAVGGESGLTRYLPRAPASRFPFAGDFPLKSRRNGPSNSHA